MILPKRRRARQGRDPEQELRQLRRRFEAVSRRIERPMRRRRLFRRTIVASLAAAAAVAAYVALTSLAPWPPMLTLRHLLAAPNCAAANAVGLAPADRGEPGYWPRHDRDQDGRACEAWSDTERWRARESPHLWRP